MSSKRNLKKLKKFFSDLKRTQEDIAARERAARREGSGLSRAERKRIARQALLPKDRICPVCNTVKLNTRQWVITVDETICKSCFMLRSQQETLLTQVDNFVKLHNAIKRGGEEQL